MNLKPIIIETQRLKLTGYSSQDMNFIFENFSKDEIKKILGHRTEEDYQKEEYKYKNGYASYNRDFILFLLTEKVTNTIIGGSALHNWNKEHHRAEIGYIITDENFKRFTQYKGEPSRTDLLNYLSNYGNMLLLSTGENGTPLVLKEALMAGLPIVINKYSSDDLDLSLPFIDVIPESKMLDIDYISDVIKSNREKSITMRDDIRKYVIDNFSWERIVKDYYIPNIK